MSRQLRMNALIGLLLTLRLAAIGTAAGDLTTTGIVLHQGGHEANPLMTKHTVIVATAMDTSLLAGIWKLEKGHPKLAAGLYLAVIGTRGFVTVHNAKEIR